MEGRRCQQKAISPHKEIVLIDMIFRKDRAMKIDLMGKEELDQKPNYACKRGGREGGINEKVLTLSVHTFSVVS